MSKREWNLFVEDILESIELIEKFASHIIIVYLASQIIQ